MNQSGDGLRHCQTLVCKEEQLLASNGTDLRMVDSDHYTNFQSFQLSLEAYFNDIRLKSGIYPRRFEAKRLGNSLLGKPAVSIANYQALPATQFTGVADYFTPTR